MGHRNRRDARRHRGVAVFVVDLERRSAAFMNTQKDDWLKEIENLERQLLAAEASKDDAAAREIRTTLQWRDWLARNRGWITKAPRPTH